MSKSCNCMAFMSSMNSRWAGGWKRRLSFEAIRYSRSEIGSNCGALMEREKCLATSACVRRRERAASIAIVVRAALLVSETGW